MESIENRVLEQLFKLADPGYAAFMAKLLPATNPHTIVGIRLPLLRKFKKELYKDLDEGELEEFLASLPHQDNCYELNMLHGFLIADISTEERLYAELERFLPYVDNWAVCDSLSPKLFKKKRDERLEKAAINWAKSDECYTRRFGIGMLLQHFLDEQFKPEHLSFVAGLTSPEYYVQMMRAWYYAEALLKQEKTALAFFRAETLDRDVFLKAVRKYGESRRAKAEVKAELKSIKLARY